MTISLKPNHLARYKDIVRLLLKYGRSDLIEQFRMQEIFEDLPDQEGKDGAAPEQLADDLENMGAVYVKLGQLLSSRPDLVPDHYLKALARLQDDVQPFPFQEAVRTIQLELGMPVSKLFLKLDPVPLAAASLGQVHRGILRDGRAVVVKVQRPDIRGDIAEELEILGEIAEFLENRTSAGKRYQFVSVFEQFRRTLIHELDYEREANNLLTMSKNLDEFRRIRIPLPMEMLTSRCVLTMEYIAGEKITDMEPEVRQRIDARGLAEELFRAYLKQILVDGLFHADPHPGNVFVTSHGEVALLDLGMVGHLSPDMQEVLLKLILAISDGNGDEAANLVIRVGRKSPDFDQARFRQQLGMLVAESRNSRLNELDTGRILVAASRAAADTGLFVPTELTILGKTLLQLDEIGRVLDASFDPNEAVRRNIGGIIATRLRKDASPAKLFASTLETTEFVGQLPARLNRILDRVADGEIDVKVKATDVNVRPEGFLKIANRITAGLIVSALIIGASLLTQIETTLRLFGYPVIAMVLFLLAAGLGLYLVVSILVQDRRTKKHPANGG